MKNFKDLLNNLDKTDLKIMKIGIKFSFMVLIFAISILVCYLFLVHTVFLYSLGIAVFKLGSYFVVEFIVCGLVADNLKKQLE